MSDLLITHEVGSLAKPPWRVHAIRDIPLKDPDILHATHWGEFLSVENYQDLIQLLQKRYPFTSDDKRKIKRFSSIYGIKFLEKTGLDLIWDGEQHRVEMYEYPIQQIKGFVFKDHVRSFDHKFYRKAACIEKPKCDAYHVEEYLEIKCYTHKRIKIPITGAYTLMDWSYDEYYSQRLIPGMQNIQNATADARKQLLFDLTSEVIYPNLKALYNLGVPNIQIDEPAATTKRNEIPLFIESVAQSIRDLKGKAFFTLHICFSDYLLLFPEVEKLQGFIDEIQLEYANRDSKELGVTSSVRTGYDMIKQLANYSFIIGLGVIDVHSDFIESPELIRDRILYALEIVKNPASLRISPDCGLRTRNWDVAFHKLLNMVKGRDLVLKELSL